MTNFEKIKSMGVDELAEKLNDLFTCDHCPLAEFCDEIIGEMTCTGVLKEWLESEAKENEL